MLLKERILLTLRFFDLQDFPLTLLELHQYLLPQSRELKEMLDENGEIKSNLPIANLEPAGIDEVLDCLDGQCQSEVKNFNGFYFLADRQSIARARWENYLYGIQREKLIKRFAGGLRHAPFVRGVGLSGSQALGQQKAGSDIDLLIIVEPKFLWLARTFATAYFQVLDLRRHGRKIANRFCLNHYLSGPKIITRLKNLYTALEYGKLRPLVYGQAICRFQQNNAFWIERFFPHWRPTDLGPMSQSKVQKLLEKLFSNRFGDWLESKLKNWQLAKIRREPFIIVEDDELSFHPDSKQRGILEKFFSNL